MSPPWRLTVEAWAGGSLHRQNSQGCQNQPTCPWNRRPDTSWSSTSSKIADGLPLSGVERLCSRHHRNNRV